MGGDGDGHFSSVWAVGDHFSEMSHFRKDLNERRNKPCKSRVRSSRQRTAHSWRAAGRAGWLELSEGRGWGGSGEIQVEGLAAFRQG